MTLAGRFGTIVRLDAVRTAAPLWRVFGGHDEIWTYISGHGPFTGEKAFTAWLEGRETQSVCMGERWAFSRSCTYGGRCAIEIGSIVYSSEPQRPPLGSEAQYLLARYAFEALGYRRYEWKCDSLNASSRRAPCVTASSLKAFSAGT